MVKEPIIWILLLIGSQAYGQTSISNPGKWSLQIMAGANNSKYYKFNIPWHKPTRSIASHFESIGFGYQINKSIGFSIGLNNISNGYSIELTFTDYDGNPIGKSNIRTNHWTIQTPVQIAIKPSTSIPIIIHFGGYLGFNYLNTSHSSNDQFNIEPSPELNNIDMEILSGLTFNWFTTEKFILGNHFSYYRGFSNLNPNPQFVQKVHGITLSVVGSIQL